MSYYVTCPSLAIKLTIGGNTRTIGIYDGKCYRTQTEAYVDNDHIISLDEVNAAVTRAENAATRANSAAASIEGMTVSATTSATPSVQITTQNGVKHIAFGLPAGNGGSGGTGERGTGLLNITTAPSSYTTAVGGVTPAFRIALSTVLTQSGLDNVLVGDALMYSFYRYPVVYVDATYVYTGARVNVRGAAGAAGAKGADGVSVTHSWDGTVLTLTSASGTSSVDLKGEPGDGGGDSVTIPSYWQSHVDSRITDIRNALEAAGWDKSAFLWYTDSHWTSNHQNSPALLRYLHRHTGINRINYGGDIVDNESADVTDMSYLYAWREQIRNLPHHSVAGNHDDGNATDDRYTKQAIYSFLLAAEESPDIVRGNGGLYYYLDSPAEKTRYIYMDSATKTGNIYYDTDQQAFVKEALKSTPSGWHIIPIAHIWLNVDYDQNPPVATTPSYGGQWMLDQFDAYNMRNGEYASCGGTVEFCIGGHSHVDNDYVSTTGIPVILTECDGKHIRSGLDCTAGTINENSVNAIVADYTNKVVNVIRIGRGSSRTVDINHRKPVTYTNQLPIATDENGAVYNGTGFKANTRFSTSSKAETAATGWYLTGFIPCKKNDVVRLQGVEFMDMDGSLGGTSRAQIYLYDANKVYYSCSTNYTPSAPMPDAWEAVYGDDGNVIQFKLPSSYDSTFVYIRIGAAYMDENSVITVNEVIE